MLLTGKIFTKESLQLDFRSVLCFNVKGCLLTFHTQNSKEKTLPARQSSDFSNLIFFKSDVAVKQSNQISISGTVVRIEFLKFCSTAPVKLQRLGSNSSSKSFVSCQVCHDT